MSLPLHVVLSKALHVFALHDMFFTLHLTLINLTLRLDGVHELQATRGTSGRWYGKQIVLLCVVYVWMSLTINFGAVCVCNCLVSLTSLTTDVWVSIMTISSIGVSVSIICLTACFPYILDILGWLTGISSQPMTGVTGVRQWHLKTKENEHEIKDGKKNKT